MRCLALLVSAVVYFVPCMAFGVEPKDAVPEIRLTYTGTDGQAAVLIEFDGVRIEATHASFGTGARALTVAADTQEVQIASAVHSGTGKYLRLTPGKLGLGRDVVPSALSGRLVICAANDGKTASLEWGRCRMEIKSLELVTGKNRLALSVGSEGLRVRSDDAVLRCSELEVTFDPLRLRTESIDASRK